MTDIVVQTPLYAMTDAVKEAEAAKRAHRLGMPPTYYWRRLGDVGNGPNIKPGDKVWYQEDGYLRGYCIVERVYDSPKPFVCGTTNKCWGPGKYVIMRADSWKWTEPIRKQMPVRRWAYAKDNPPVVGDWLAKRPPTPMESYADRMKARRAAR